MANEQHIQWLLEGVEAWNRRREENRDISADLAGSDLTYADLTYADLTGVILTYADLTGASLFDADLTSADLTSADLTSADLTSANLAGTDFTNTNLTGADLTGADLTRAIISYANLTDAQFEKANLTEAELVLAKCNGAKFVDANFTRTNLTGTQLWSAKIYGVGKSPAPIQIPRRFVGSVENLLNIVKRIQIHHDYSGYDFCMYFRGEHRTEWKLQPSITRDSNLRLHENKMLIDLIAQRPDEFNELTSGLARFVTAQHHGLRTRFLDVSSNPLIALFHACAGEIRQRNGQLHIFVAPRNIVKSFTSDTVSIVANYARLPIDLQMALSGNYDATSHPHDIYNVAMDQLYQLIQSEKPYFVQRIDPRDFYRVIIVEPQQTSERIRAQAGAFLVSAFHERFERDEILKQNADIPVYAHYQLIVPAGRKSAILDELKMLKVTHDNLFPGPDASAKAITEIYLARQ